MTVLLTGGAGYIGAHVLREIRRTGEDAVVVDDLSTGRLARLGDTPFEILDLAAADQVDPLVAVMARYRVDSVIHLAAKKRVDESVARPAHYYRQNVGGLATVVEAATLLGVRHVVLSSSAAVYGAVGGGPVAEDAPCDPVNPYGRSKLAGEWMISDATRNGSIEGCSLRYFNVAGAGDPSLVDEGGTNLIPATIARMRRGDLPTVFGTDFPTPDGSGVRDYVHVVDLALAHVAALHGLRAGTAATEYNVGAGRGYSVLEVISEVARRTGRPADAHVLPRREGDPASVVADPSRIARDLGWSAERGLDEIVASSLAERVRTV